MAEKRKPVYIFLLKKLGNDAGRKTNKIEVFPSSLWEQKYGRGDPRSKYRLRVNGRWWPKGGYTYFWKTEIMAQISKAINFYTIPKSYTMSKPKLTPDSVMDLITKKQEGETGDGITDYTYNEGHKAVKDYGDQRAADAVEEAAQILPAEAVMAFIGWATCQPGALILGAAHDATWAVAAYERYRQSQDWEEPREDFMSRMKPMN